MWAMRAISHVVAVMSVAAALVVSAGSDAGAASTCNGLAPTPVTVQQDAAGNQVVIGTDGDDVIITGSGHDVIEGLRGDDTICSGDGEDLVDGGNGNDWIDAGAGDDVVSGFAGDDHITPGFGFDSVSGDAGHDVLDYSRQDARPACGTGVVVPALPAGTALATSSAWPCIETDTFESIEGVIGSPVDDLLTGGPDPDFFDGSGGADFIEGLGGDDVLRGGAGDDNIYGGAAGVFVTVALSGSDQLFGDGGDDVLGCVSNDDHYLHGGSGDDELRSCNRDDEIIGGSGIDTVRYDGAGGAAGAGVTIDLALQPNPQATGAFGTDTLRGIENVVGTGNDDTLEGDAGDNVLDGGAGHDVGDGRAGHDICFNFETRQNCEG